jgi:hypothetical protein
MIQMRQKIYWGRDRIHIAPILLGARKFEKPKTSEQTRIEAGEATKYRVACR